MDTTDSLNLNRVGQLLMGLVNVLQDSAGNAAEKQAAVCCLFNLITHNHSERWEFQEFADHVLADTNNISQFYAARQYVKNDLI